MKDGYYTYTAEGKFKRMWKVENDVPVKVWIKGGNGYVGVGSGSHAGYPPPMSMEEFLDGKNMGKLEWVDDEEMFLEMI